jgi:perosamine synthetase
MKLRIPLSAPDITEAEIDAVNAVLRTNTLSLGPKLQEFEDALAGFHQIPHAIAVSSGTAALHLVVRALGISEGDEVIVPAFTFIAVANAVRYERAIPVFADIDPLTLNLSPACVEAAITPRTRAIIIVHTFGVPAEMSALTEIARQYNLKLIEDACEAIGAIYNDRRVGIFGDASIFAFYPNKQMTTGEGGAILCRDPDLAERMRALRNQGRYPSNEWLQHNEIGYNYRLSEMACALGLVQLGRLESMLIARASVACTYDDLLDSIGDIELPLLHLPSRTISWFVYVIRLANHYPNGTRDHLLQRLQSRGIGCARYFAPTHLQPAYATVASAQRAMLPITESVAARTLALPFFNRLSRDNIEDVVSVLSEEIVALTGGI